MKTVQLTLDESLLEEVDKAARELGTSRSAFTRGALRAALRRRRIKALEERHRGGYELRPVEPSELHEWEEEQVWPD